MFDSEEQQKLHYWQMTEQDGEAICQWKYTSPYDVYNWPSWVNLKAEQREFADPNIRKQQYYSVKNSTGQLVAFYQLFPLQDTIRLGIFVHPLLLNQGIGKQVCRLPMQTASERFLQPSLDLEVTAWNHRAIHVYEQIGFQIQDEYELLNRTTHQTELVYNMVFKK